MTDRLWAKGKKTGILKEVSGATSGLSGPIGRLEWGMLLRRLELEAQNPPSPPPPPLKSMNQTERRGRVFHDAGSFRQRKGAGEWRSFSPCAQWGPGMDSYCPMIHAHSRHYDHGSEHYKASAPVSWHLPRAAVNSAVEFVF